MEAFRPAKRINISGNPLGVAMPLGPEGSTAMMDGAEDDIIAGRIAKEPDGDEEKSIKRKDKGKGKAKPPVELPDVVWTRIFEFFYDSVCQGESEVTA